MLDDTHSRLIEGYAQDDAPFDEDSELPYHFIIAMGTIGYEDVERMDVTPIPSLQREMLKRATITALKGGQIQNFRPMWISIRMNNDVATFTKFFNDTAPVDSRYTLDVHFAKPLYFLDSHASGMNIHQGKVEFVNESRADRATATKRTNRSTASTVSVPSSPSRT